MRELELDLIRSCVNPIAGSPDLIEKVPAGWFSNINYKHLFLWAQTLFSCTGILPDYQNFIKAIAIGELREELRPVIVDIFQQQGTVTTFELARRCAKKVLLTHIGDEAFRQGDTPGSDVDLSQIEEILEQINSLDTRESRPIKNYFDKDVIDARYEQVQEIIGQVQPTGFPRWDWLLKYHGLFPQDLVHLVGVTGLGKSTFLRFLMRNFLIQGCKVLYLYGDESEGRTILELDHTLTGYDPAIRENEAKIKQSLGYMREIHGCSLVIQEFFPEVTTVQEVDQIISDCMEAEGPFDIAILDRPEYLVVDGTPRGQKKNYQDLSYITRMNKTWCKKYDFIMINPWQATKEAMGLITADLNMTSGYWGVHQDCDETMFILAGNRHLQMNRRIIQHCKSRQARKGIFWEIWIDPITKQWAEIPPGEELCYQ